MENSEPSGRSKRVKADKHGRFAALQKLKTLKGNKNKYEIIEESPVYEEVTEKDFSRLVQERQEDDWIVDDDGCGYVEDGREIFDDDYADEEKEHTTKVTKTSTKRKGCEPPGKVQNKRSDIKNMFKAQTAKRKNEDIKLDDDDLLGSIMAEVHSDTMLTSKPLAPRPTVLHKKPKPSFPSTNFTSPIRPPPPSNGRLNPFSTTANKLTPKAASKPQVSMKPKSVNYDRSEENGHGDLKKIAKDTNDVGSQEKVEEIISTEDIDFNMSNDLFGSMEEEIESDTPAATNGHTQVDDDIENGMDDDITESLSLLKEEDLESPASTPSFLPESFSAEPVSAKLVVDVQVHADQLPIETMKNNSKGIKFFWFDAVEDPYKNPGIVYLFGKVYVKECDAYVSCCVLVKDIHRKVYVLPRETRMNLQTNTDTGKPVTMQEVYTEINSYAEKMKITEFKTKKSEKNYAFDNTDIPDKSEYLEVQYSARFPPFPSDLKGATFNQILGTDTSSLEILLLEQKLKGPCWLEIHNPEPSNPHVSWCKFEVVVNKIQNVIPSVEARPTPPLVVLSLRLLTVVNSRTQQNEIVALSCLSHDKFFLDKAAPKPHYTSHFCALTKPSDCIFPYDFKEVLSRNNALKIECLPNERALLAFFLAKLHKLDPDVIIGHDVVGFDLDVLLHRITAHKIPNWSRIGRLKRTVPPRFNSSNQGFIERNAASGRLICDIKISAKELLRCRSYDLPELSNHILERQCEEVTSEHVRNYFTSSQKLMQLVDNSMCCSDAILRIVCELNTLPLALQITNIAGCVFSRTLLGGRSERNEFLLLHAFHEKNYIYPSKVQSKKNAKLTEETGEKELPGKKGRRKPAYEGGLVLEPKKGFYDKYILLMDFNSLYPSIIQEYNICFTTMPRTQPSGDIEDNLDSVIPTADTEPGILPTEIRKLVESRRMVKNMMKASDLPKDKLMQYDIRQSALKITANSMYGCLGFSHSRFYAKALAALVTRKGREILMQTKGMVEKMGLDVIYGDTDSIMINTNQTDYDAVFQLGNKVKSEINRLYRLLEIDIDGVYKPMLLLKKKKYAAVSVSRLPDNQLSMKQEMKGLDIVRRDWSQLAKEAGEYVLKEILSTKSKEDVLENIHQYMISLGEEIKSGKKPLSVYTILKQLTKNPEEYVDKKNLSHVMVAVRMNEKNGKKLKQNDTIPYIICLDGSNSAYTQRAYHPDEMKSNSSLKIDVEYYLSNQVHPVVSRLCNPIEGTDSAVIAGLLGLNPSKYATVVKEEEQYEDKLLTASSVFDDDDRFKSCDSLVFACPADSCIGEICLDGNFNNITQLSSCSKCKTFLPDYRAAFSNQLQRIMRKYIQKYYHRVLICEDSGCSHNTRKIPLIFNSGGPLCPICKAANLKAQFSEEELYAQLAYFSFLFEKVKKLSSSEKVDPDVIELYSSLKDTASKILKSSGYAEVDLENLFQGLFLPPPV